MRRGVGVVVEKEKKEEEAKRSQKTP